MDKWDNDYLDLRYGTRDGSACVAFSWEGFNDTDPASSRGWAMLDPGGRLVGDLYMLNSDSPGFVVESE